MAEALVVKFQEFTKPHVHIWSSSNAFNKHTFFCVFFSALNIYNFMLRFHHFQFQAVAVSTVTRFKTMRKENMTDLLQSLRRVQMFTQHFQSISKPSILTNLPQQ